MFSDGQNIDHDRAKHKQWYIHSQTIGRIHSRPMW
jgi:hypothetical protein